MGGRVSPVRSAPARIFDMDLSLIALFLLLFDKVKGNFPEGARTHDKGKMEAKMDEFIARRSALVRKFQALRLLSQVGMWLWPALTVGMWLFLEFIPTPELLRMAGEMRLGPGVSLVQDPSTVFHITWKVKLLGAAVALVPASFQFLFMRQWARLFDLYRRGRIFETENVKCFLRMGRHLLVLAVWDIAFSMPMHSLVLTADNPPGKHTLAFGLSSDHVPVLATGIALVVIAWAMDEGRKLRQDADLVV